MDERAVAMLAARFDIHYDASLVEREAELRQSLASADALIVRNRTQVTAELIDAAPKLCVVGRLGVGLDNIDSPACAARGITVIPATGANAQAVAEYVIAAAMVLLRGAYGSTREVAGGEWPRDALSNGRELSGKTLGVIGLGSIGRVTGRIARLLGMRIVGFDANLPMTSPVWADEATSGRTLDQLLAEADVVTLHVPLTPATRNLIDVAALAKMKPAAILINTARGGGAD